MIEHWRLLFSQLFWAYDRPLKRKLLRWEYAAHPPVAWFLRKGHVVLEAEAGGTRRYEAGQWIFPGLGPKYQEFSADAHLMSIRFLLEWPDGRHLFDRTQTVTVSEADARALNAVSEKLVRFTARHFPPTSSSQSFIHATLSQYIKLQPVFSQWLACYYTLMQGRAKLTSSLRHLQQKTQQALHYLNARSFASPLQESEVAEAVGVSSSYLHKIFVKEVGITPLAYWNHRKLRSARSELAGGSRSIKSIAYDLGFSSPENFAHWFRSQTNQSPRQYRDDFTGSA